MTDELYIPGFTTTCLLITAAVCLAAVFVAWYTTKSRIKLSQVILGLFAYVLVMLLENVFSALGGDMRLPGRGVVYGLYVTLSMVAAREVVRFLAMRYGLKPRFDNTDSAIGFALGFAGAYLLICAAYYFNCYTTASEYAKSGQDAFLSNAGADAQAAMDLLKTIAGQSAWQFIATGVNRVFFLVREVALCVMLYYALDDGRLKYFYLVVPAISFAALLPDGLYQAEVLTNSYVKDLITCLISGGAAFWASRLYNAREDQVAHFKVERLRARRRR